MVASASLNMANWWLCHLCAGWLTSTPLCQSATMICCCHHPYGSYTLVNACACICAVWLQHKYVSSVAMQSPMDTYLVALHFLYLSHLLMCAGHGPYCQANTNTQPREVCNSARLNTQGTDMAQCKTCLCSGTHALLNPLLWSIHCKCLPPTHLHSSYTAASTRLGSCLWLSCMLLLQHRGRVTVHIRLWIHAILCCWLLCAG